MVSPQTLHTPDSLKQLKKADKTEMQYKYNQAGIDSMWLCLKSVVIDLSRAKRW